MALREGGFIALKRPFLSVVLIVKNEEAVLGRALASAAGPDVELVVVDTGSTDRTVAIAEEAGAKVHHFAWIGDFAAARNHALAQATGEWLLVLDADETLAPDLHPKLRQVLVKAPAATAFRVMLRSVDEQERTQMTAVGIRLFRNDHGYRYEGRIHEKVTSDGRPGNVLADHLELEILHHGYVAAEDLRKDRRTRNRELLEAAHAAEPEEPRYWHYLGLELLLAGERERGMALLDRVLSRAAGHELAGWAASLLSSALEEDGDDGTALAVAQQGLDQPTGRGLCLARIGRIALREGDAATAQRCASELERHEDALSTRAEAQLVAVELRAGALVELAPALPRTRDALVALVKKHPGSITIADLLVAVCERIGGPERGALDALRRSGNAPVVVSAAMKLLARKGLDARCAELARSGVRNETYPFVLARLGRRDEAREAALALPDVAVAETVAFGLLHEDEDVLAHGLRASTPAHALVIEALRAGTKVAPSHAWIVRAWLRAAITAGEKHLAQRLGAALPGGSGGLHALLLLQAGEPMAALTIALEHAGEPDALTVIGLVAHAHGDLPAAVGMLSLRARSDAPAAVYLKAADALARLGKKADAATMLAAGRDARPFSWSFSGPRSHAA